MTVLTLATMSVAAITALLLAHYWPGHTPAAAALVALAALALLGLARLPAWAEAARELGAVAVTPALALAVTWPVRWRLTTAAVVGVAALAVVLRDLKPANVFFVVALAVAAGALVVYVRRTLAARGVLGSASLVALMLVVLDVGTLAIPQGPSRLAAWPSLGHDGIIEIGPLVVFAVVSAAQVIVLWTLPPSSPSSSG